MKKTGDEFQSKAAEVMKKVLTVGVGAAFLTEESLRSLVSEFKLPKELLTGLLDSANKTKEEFLNNLSRETVSKILAKVDPSALMSEFLTRHEVELNVKINFKSKEKPISTKPDEESDEVQGGADPFSKYPEESL